MRAGEPGTSGRPWSAPRNPDQLDVGAWKKRGSRNSVFGCGIRFDSHAASRNWHDENAPHIRFSPRYGVDVRSADAPAGAAPSPISEPHDEGENVVLLHDPIITKDHAAQFVSLCHDFLIDDLSTLPPVEQQILRGPSVPPAAWEVVSKHLITADPDSYYKARGRDHGDEGIVYFILAATGLVKIGRTADLESRWRQLRAGSPSPLKYLGFLPENGNTERFLHAYFKSDWVRFEWFAPSRKLLLLALATHVYDAITGLDQLIRAGDLRVSTFNSWLNKTFGWAEACA